MIEFTESVYVPNVGGYKTGDHACLGKELERQLVRAGKARVLSNQAELAAMQEKVLFSGGVRGGGMEDFVKGIEPSLTDD